MADAVELCCLLWAREGERTGLSEYEDRVLALVAEHRGEVVQRAIGDGVGDGPDEVQLYRFLDDAALQGYLADPRRVALADERDRVIARTELFPVTIR
jgi:hypothetical protein